MASSTPSMLQSTPSARWYYDDGTVAIYHGRAGDFPLVDGDCLITDPPYGFGAYRSDRKPRPEFLSSLISAHRSAAVFGYPEQLIALCVERHLRPDEWVTWWPTNAIVGRTTGLNRESECVAIFGRTNASSLTQPRSAESVQIAEGHNSVKNKTHRVAGDVWRDPKPGMAFNAHLRQHPNEKPVSLMAKLVTLCSDVGDVVFDPYCGSGSTLRAAKDLGRRAVGVEIEERYCEIAAKRCSQDVLAVT